MMDKKEMKSQLESMERAATKVLQQDPAFIEALQALRREIERDPRVRSALRNLRCSGHSVYRSFVPHVKVQIRSEEGILTLHPDSEPSVDPEARPETLSQELRNAATAVILTSRIRQELDSIVNEAISASHTFENIATEIEHRGYEISICLDLSSYARVRKAANPVPHFERNNPTDSSQQTYRISLSDYDLKFMKSLRIKTD